MCVKECPKLADDAIDCLTTSKVAECKVNGDHYNSKQVVNICFPTEAPESIKAGFKKMKAVFENSSAGKYVNDLYLSSTSCYISIGMSVVYCLVYIFLMSMFAEYIAWFCVVLLQVALAGASAALWMYRQ